MPRRDTRPTALYVRDVGQGLPVLFLHAFPLHGGMWRPQLDALRGRARLLAPDLRGCGRSPILSSAGPPLSLDREDAFTPPDLARATAERLFGGRTEIIPGVGHLTNLEAPEAFDEALPGAPGPVLARVTGRSADRRRLMHWPDPTTEEPKPETLMEWADEGGCQATDGCWLGQDSDACEHGYPSWAIVLGLAPPLSGE